MWLNVFPVIVKDFLKIRNLRKIFLRSFENVAPGSKPLCSAVQFPNVQLHAADS